MAQPAEDRSVFLPQGRWRIESVIEETGACQGFKMLSEDYLGFASLPGEFSFSPADL